MSRFPYEIVYRRRPDGIVIVAVAHLKGMPGYWKDRVQFDPDVYPRHLLRSVWKFPLVCPVRCSIRPTSALTGRRGAAPRRDPRATLAGGPVERGFGRHGVPAVDMLHPSQIRVHFSGCDPRGLAALP